MENTWFSGLRCLCDRRQVESPRVLGYSRSLDRTVGNQMNATLLAVFILGQANAEPRLVLHTTDERLVPGVVERLDASGILIVGHPVVAGAEVVALRRLNIATPPWPREAHLLLANGDRIVGKPLGIEGSFLIFRADGNRTESERLRFPLTTCSILWLRSPDTVERQSLLEGERADDQVIFRNGDVLAGVLTAIDPIRGEFIVETGGMKRNTSVGKIAAIAFSTKLARVRKPTGLYWHLVLTNGTRLTLTTATIDKGVLRGQTMYKNPVQIALADVAALDAYQGKAVYLSDLKPTRYDYRSYQGEKREWTADRALDGRELQLQSPSGSIHFDKGLATHGECGITYSLDCKYRRFECHLGIDPRLGKRGSASVRILVDGKETKVNDGKQLTLASGMMPLRVDVLNAKELKLIVEWGDGGNVGDCVNWCDARLIP